MFAFLLPAALVSVFALAGCLPPAVLEVTNMDCAACVITVRKALGNASGVDKVTVDIATKRAVVTFDPAKTTPAALTKAAFEAGFPSTVQQVQ